MERILIVAKTVHWLRIVVCIFFGGRRGWAAGSSDQSLPRWREPGGLAGHRAQRAGAENQVAAVMEGKIVRASGLGGITGAWRTPARAVDD
jgi:hypothetical protein